MHSFTTEKPTGLSRAIVLAFTLAAPLVSSSCATEPPPKPAQFDPANPGATESKPLEIGAASSLAAAPSRGVPAAPSAGDAAPNNTDEHATDRHPSGSAPGMRLEKKPAPPPGSKPHDHQHGPGGSP